MYDLLQTIQEALLSPAVSGNLQTATIITIVKSITGENPIVTSYPGYTEISFSPSQQIKLRAYLERMLSKEPGTVRMQLGPVIYPVVLKRLIPVLLITFSAGFVLSSFFRKK